MAEQNKVYFVTDVPAANRFLQGDRPTEAVFRDLFDSLRFGAESADSASTSRHGLIKKATDAEIIARSAADSNSFTLGVTPDKMPEVEAADNTITVTPDISSGHFKYQIAANPANINQTLPDNGAWVNITPNAGFVNINQSRYRLLTHDKVELYLSVNRPLDTNFLITTLPAGFRPTNILSFDVTFKEQVLFGPIWYDFTLKIDLAGQIYIDQIESPTLPSGPNIGFTFSTIYSIT